VTGWLFSPVFLCKWSAIAAISLIDFQEDFDVDHFVSDCRKRVQLEELRDDLELYYKLLKTAMVELINKDYADFVNLSTNLVSCDSTVPARHRICTYSICPCRLSLTNALSLETF
jgi:hypothetical protein